MIEDITEVQDMIYDYHGIDMTEEQISDLLSNHKGLVGEINQHGATDTCIRGAIADLISIKITGKNWPCSGFGDAKDWYSEMSIGIPKHGYRFTEHSVFSEGTEE